MPVYTVRKIMSAKARLKFILNRNLVLSAYRLISVQATRCFQQTNYQRWSRGHKARGLGQGHKKNPRPRPRTAFPRTDTLEAKDRNARGQGPRTQAQVLSKKKKKVFTKIFQAISTKLEASRPRPRTSKSVLEDYTSANYTPVRSRFYGRARKFPVEAFSTPFSARTKF